MYWQTKTWTESLLANAFSTIDPRIKDKYEKTSESEVAEVLTKHRTSTARETMLRPIVILVGIKTDIVEFRGSKTHHKLVVT